MNLYLLKPVTKSAFPAYDAAFGFVVRSYSEWNARILAAVQAGDEGSDAWKNPIWTTCEMIAEDVPGEAQVILRDFNAG